MFFGKKLLAIAFAVILSMLMMVPVYAANDRIYGDDDVVVSDGSIEYYWEKIDDTWICTDSNGDPVIGWAKREGNTYYLDKNGEIKTGWIKSSGKWYYMYTESDAKNKVVDKALVGTLAKDTWIDNYYVDKDGVQTKIKK